MKRNDPLPLADILREHLQGDQTAQLTVSSNSMTPLLASGDVIGLQEATAAHIQPGQIITFQDPSDLQHIVTHRIAAIGQDERGRQLVITSGDAALAFDPPVYNDGIIGRVIWRVRNGRKLHLDRGSGAWLARRLGEIAAGERRHISGVSPLDLYPRAGAIEHINRRTKIRQKRLVARLVRLAGRLWMEFLASIVLLFSNQERTQTRESL